MSRIFHTVQPGAALKSKATSTRKGLLRAHLGFLNLSLIKRTVHLGGRTESGEERQHPWGAPVTSPPALQLPAAASGAAERLAHVECSAPSLGLSERAPPCEYKQPRPLRFPSRPRTTPHFPSKNSVGEDPTCKLPRLYSWPVLIFRFFFASQTSFTASSASDGVC